MPQRYPVEIAVTPDRTFAITWDDSHQSVIPIDMLRDFCPCATCRKARSERTSAPPQARRRSLTVLGAATRYEVGGLEHVGRYGLGVNWKDSHNSIYSYEYLARICPCDMCTLRRGGPPVPFDPV